MVIDFRVWGSLGVQAHGFWGFCLGWQGVRVLEFKSRIEVLVGSSGRLLGRL